MSLRGARHAGIAHDGTQVLKQGAEAMRRRAVRQSMREELL